MATRGKQEKAGGSDAALSQPTDKGTAEGDAQNARATLSDADDHLRALTDSVPEFSRLPSLDVTTEQQEEDAAFLRGLAAFAGLTEGQALFWAQRGSRQRFKQGETILEAGAPGDSMAVILAGSVRIPITDEQGRERFVAHLGPGDLFGEIAILTGEPRAASVYADSDIECAVLMIGKDDVDLVMRENPAVAGFLTEVLGRRLLESGGLRTVGKYHLLGELGRGGGAIVYEGYHSTLHRSVAVKMLSHELVYEGDFAERFQQEAQTVAELRHDNIVQVFDCERAYATFFIVMEKLSGAELSALIRESAMSWDEARHVLRQVARALLYAHRQGVVHQDVKPSNIFIEDNGRAKLMDFGIASSPVAEASARRGVMGTPGYIAPEVMMREEIDGRADIYALGVIAYEMLTGETPFKARKKIELLREQLHTPSISLPSDLDVPDEARTLVTKATALDPKDRFASCAAILRHLDDREHLRGESGAVVAINVAFPEDRRDAIRRAVTEFRDQLTAIGGVQLAISELESLSSDD